MATLHRLRSALARVQAEVELLELDGGQVASLAEGVAEAFKVLAALEAGPHRWFRPMAVVLEDEERLGILTTRALCRHGVPAVMAGDLNAAVLLAGAGAILVADLSALSTDSAEMQAAVRQLRPVILTGGVLSTVRVQAEELGARASYLKPVDVAALAADLIHSAGEQQ